MHKPKHKRLAILTVLLMGFGFVSVFGLSQKVYAQSCSEITDPAKIQECEGRIADCNLETNAEIRDRCKNGVYQSYGLADDTGSGNFEADCVSPNVDKSNCGIINYLVTFINVLSGLVGIIIVAIITFRGVQYTFSRDNPQIVAQARDGIRDAVFALVYFLLIFAFLQWVVPGGIF